MHKLEQDLLKREDEIEFLITYLTNRYKQSKNKLNENKSFVLNINAIWGSGKTYFLKSLSNKLKSENYTVIEFDAWKNDYTKEPLLAFMSELNNSLESFFTAKNTKAKSFLKNLRNNSLPILMSVISRKLTGYTLDELLEENETKNTTQENSSNDYIVDSVSSLTTKLTEFALEEHNTIKKSIEEFKKSMIKLLKHIETLSNKKLPLFILIDELDRCRPNYAIDLLENIKHLFDIEGLYFIIATDSTQLSHSINAIYGSNFASEKYLKRFFDQEYKLKSPSNYEYIKSLFNYYNLLSDNLLYSPLEKEFYEDEDTKVKLFELFVELFNLKPRDINQIMISLYAIRMTWNSDKNIHLVFILFLIILKHLNNNDYNKFINTIINPNYSYHPSIIESIIDFNVNYTEIKIQTNKYKKDNGLKTLSYSENISFIQIIQHYIKFYNMTYENFSKNYQSSQLSIIHKIDSELRKEINPNNIEKVIDVSILKYHNLVEHTGQLS